MDLSLLLALPIFLLAIGSGLDMFVGVRQMTRLLDVEPLPADQQPLVSLVVPACNEEENVERAMRSFLAQDYSNIEIVAINDRSTDNTGTLLDRLAAGEERLRVIHIHGLTEGWMGKANALQRGAAEAKGEYLIFTDGDIVMAPTTVARAMHHMAIDRLDHISLIFKNTSPGWLLNSLILDAGAGLFQLFRPWRVRDKRSKHFIGVGAFNLVRKEAYSQVGGHSRIKMHPIDDIMLGKMLKQAGFKQDCLLGHDLVTVPWYNSVSQMVNGLMKNVLAMVNYRFSLVPFYALAIVYCNILPLWGMVLCSGWTQLLFTAVMVIKLMAFFTGTRLLSISPWCTFGTIVSPYITLYIVIKATWRNFRDGGVFWRGTHYPLAELKKNEPLLL